LLEVQSLRETKTKLTSNCGRIHCKHFIGVVLKVF